MSPQLQQLSVLHETPQPFAENSKQPITNSNSHLNNLKPLSPNKARKVKAIHASSHRPHVRSNSSSSVKLQRTESSEIERLTEGYKKTVAQVKNTYAVMALVKMHLERHKTFKKTHADEALEKVRHFISANESDRITPDFLDALVVKIQKNPTALTELRTKGVLEATRMLNQKAIETYKIPMEQVISAPRRLDKRDTHFHHTLVESTSGKWFEQFKSYDLDNAYDNKAMRHIHEKELLPKGWAKAVEGSPNKYQAILGSGGRGIVILARDMADESFWADKKSWDIASLQREHTEAQHLKADLPEEDQDKFLMMEHFSETVGSQKNDKQENLFKGYGFIPLAQECNQFYAAYDNLQQLKKGQIQGFINNNFALLFALAKLEQVLSKAHKLHPDFKLENIMGHQAGDLADLIGPGQKIPESSWTPQYTMPRVVDKEKMTDDEFDTFHRFSIGSSMIISNTGKAPAMDDTPAELRLPMENQRIQKGYAKDSFDTVPDTILGQQATDYQKDVLKLSKRLMADDRSLVTPQKLNLQSEVMKLSKYVDASFLTNTMKLIKL